MAHFQPTQTVNASRYIIVPCEADGSSDLDVIWDRLEEQVVDVISAAASRVRVGVEPTNEEWVAARHAQEVLALG